MGKNGEALRGEFGSISPRISPFRLYGRVHQFFCDLRLPESLLPRLTKGIEKGPDCFRDHGQKSGGVTDTDAVAEHPEEVQCLSVSFIFRKRVVAEASKVDMVVLQH